jgi:hypothetical protein
MAILEQALEGDRSPAPPRHSGKTLEEVFAELRRKYPKPVRGQPLGVDIIRQDRDSR